MKKLLGIVLAALLVFSVVPAMAGGGNGGAMAQFSDDAEAKTSASDSAGWFGINGKTYAKSHGVSDIEGRTSLSNPSNFHYNLTLWGTGLVIDGTVTPMVQADAFGFSASIAVSQKQNGWGTAGSQGIAGTQSSAWTELRKGEQIDKTVTAYLFGWNLGSKDFSFQDLEEFSDRCRVDSHVHVSGLAEQTNGNATLDINFGSGIAIIGGGNQSDAKYKGDGWSSGWSQADGSATATGGTNMLADQTGNSSEIGGISMSTAHAFQTEYNGHVRVSGEGFIAGTTYVSNGDSTASTLGKGTYGFMNSGRNQTGATGFTTISGYSSVNGSPSISQMHVQSVVTSASSID